MSCSKGGIKPQVAHFFQSFRKGRFHMGKVSKVVLYTTSTATTLKLKADIKRIRELLQAKKVHYEEVSGQEIPQLVQQAWSKAPDLLQRHVTT